MTEHFKFLEKLPIYEQNREALNRLDQRYKLIISPFLNQIHDATVLDLAAHDGRWSSALVEAGARHVTGVEGRPELIKRFNRYARGDLSARTDMINDDIFAYLEWAIERGKTFDVVALFGIFYHVMDHMRLLRLIQQLKPSLILIDSEFITVDNAMIQILREKTENELNAIEQDGWAIDHTLVGVPSEKALEFMAEVIGYEVSWVSAELLLGDNRENMHDYFRSGRKRRSACALSLRSS